MSQTAWLRYAGTGACYGICRGIVKTQNARIRDYDQDMNRYTRPLMVTERVSAITYSAAINMVWAPITVCCDLHAFEHKLRGYPKTDPVASTVLELVFW
jgi:hypothetical protein